MRLRICLLTEIKRYKSVIRIRIRIITFKIQISAFEAAYTGNNLVHNVVIATKIRQSKCPAELGM